MEPKTVGQIHEAVLGAVSKRAIRYALDALVKSGRAKRSGRPGQHFRVTAVPS